MQKQRREYLSKEDPSKKKKLATVLQALTDPALTRLKMDELSLAVLGCLREMMVLDNLAILLLTEDHTALRIHTVLGVEETVAREVHIPLGHGFAGKIFTQGLPLIIHDTSTLEILTPVLREQLSSLLGVPLIVYQQVIGVIHVGMKREYLFTDADVALLLQVADCLAQAFARTLLIEAGQHAAEELVEAQLCAIVELVEAQQHVATELVEAQQHVAAELEGAQLRTAVELVGAQLRTAVELIETQQHTAGDLLEVQQTMAEKVVEAQLPTAGDLLEVQQTMAEKVVEAQQHTAEDLAEAQQHTVGDLAEAQQHTAGDLVEAQQHTAGDLAEAQQHTARDLVEAQLDTAGDLAEAQQYTARDLVEAQLNTTIELMETQQRVAIELMETQQRVRLKAFGYMNELETIFNAIMDGIIVYNEQGHIFRSNRAAHHLRDAYGYPLSPESLPWKRLLHGERLAAKQEVTVYLHSLENQERQLRVTGAPLYTQQKQLYGAVCVIRDVTSQKYLERRDKILDTLLEMMEHLVMSSVPKEQPVTQDALELITQQGENTILALGQRLLGCSHAILIAIHQSTHALSPLAQVGFSAKQEQRLKLSLTDAHLHLLIQDPRTSALLEKQECVSFENMQSPLLESLFPRSSSHNGYLVPIHSAHHLIGLLGIVFPESASSQHLRDGRAITAISKLCALMLQYTQHLIERDQLMSAKTVVNEQLKHMNKMQGDFISVVSHEFRTTLATIEGFSNLLRGEDYPAEEVKDYANDIYTDATRLHCMVTDVLDMEQMQKGQMQLHIVEVDVNIILTMLAKRTQLISTDHILRLSLDETLPPLEGDPEKLLQAITNILSNAIKYSPRGGVILIKSCQEGNALHVSIQDDGIGITSEDIENIFTPYHRSTATSTRYIQGTGLGLSLAREIIHLHEGKIWVESTPGHGSLFHLSLPLTRER